MRAILAIATTTALLFFGTEANAGGDVFEVGFDSTTNTNQIYSYNTATNTAALLKVFSFPSGAFSSAGSFVDPTTGNLFLQDASGVYLAYNPNTNAITNISNPLGAANIEAAFVNTKLFASQSDLLTLQSQVAAMDQKLQADSVRANQGVAMSLAMAGVGDLQSDEHIAFSGNWGTFQGQNGGAVGAAYRLNEHLSVNAGFAGSFDGRTYGGRAGFRIGW